jgi:hypothetical protein
VIPQHRCQGDGVGRAVEARARMELFPAVVDIMYSLHRAMSIGRLAVCMTSLAMQIMVTNVHLTTKTKEGWWNGRFLI